MPTIPSADRVARARVRLLTQLSAPMLIIALLIPLMLRKNSKQSCHAAKPMHKAMLSLNLGYNVMRRPLISYIY